VEKYFLFPNNLWFSRSWIIYDSLFLHHPQANLAVQENKLTIANLDLQTAQAELDAKQAELDVVQAEYEKAMMEKQVSTELDRLGQWCPIQLLKDHCLAEIGH